MEEKTQTNVNPTKMSYEELENVATQLSQQVQQLYAELQRTNINNTLKRLDVLFRVLENSSHFSSDFVIQCSEEIEDLITIKEPEEEHK